MNCIDTAAGPSYSSGEVLSAVGRCLPFEVPDTLRGSRGTNRTSVTSDLKFCVRSVFSGVGS